MALYNANAATTATVVKPNSRDRSSRNESLLFPSEKIALATISIQNGLGNDCQIDGSWPWPGSCGVSLTKSVTSSELTNPGTPAMMKNHASESFGSAHMIRIASNGPAIAPQVSIVR